MIVAGVIDWSAIQGIVVPELGQDVWATLWDVLQHASDKTAVIHILRDNPHFRRTMMIVHDDDTSAPAPFVNISALKYFLETEGRQDF
jgi:hypothetical protein